MSKYPREHLEYLHNLDTVLSDKEIEELCDICYEVGNSWFPVSDFFNDIRNTTNPAYDKNRAYKDLWLIVETFLYYATNKGGTSNGDNA